MAEGFKLDKHIPLALILTILIQSAGAFWWASKVDSAVVANSVAIKELQTARKDTLQLYERMVRVEVLLETVLEEVKH